MSCLRVIRIKVATLVLLGVRPALSAPINLTGYVESDFARTNPNVQITPIYSNPLTAGESPFIPANGWVSGWAIKDVRTSYDQATDTMYVGVDTFKNSSGVQAIVGDADGNGNAGQAGAQMATAGGVDTPHLGGHKSVTIAFAPNGPNGVSHSGTPVVVAGVPADKSQSGPGLDGFNVAAYRIMNSGIEYNYGATLTNNLGTLAFDPSPQHPGFEFTIKNFTKVPGLNPKDGYWIGLYAGTTDDVVVGESTKDLTRIPSLEAQVATPEPATVVSWALVAGGTLLHLRYRRRRAAR